MKSIIFTLFFLLSFIRVYAQVNQSRVNGIVISSSNNKPLVGATLSFKHEKTTTVSQAEGTFSIVLKGTTDTLVISHIGFSTIQIPVSNTSLATLHIRMETLGQTLEEVNVNLNTGYQQLPKERATGSFTVIDNKLYNEQLGTNVLERLKYISNGVIPLSSRINSAKNAPLLIRGMSTLTMDIQKPLIILDNFEYQGDLDNLNPNDVENVTFLKDAAASSIWGAKAANGVVVITTKKGLYNHETRISFNSNVTIAEKPDLFYEQNINSSDLIDVETMLFKNQFRFSDTSAVRKPPFSPVYEILFKQKNGSISASDAESQINGFRNHDLRNDFNKYFYRQAINQQYALSLQGGSKEIAWSMSGGADKNINELKTDYNRLNLKISNTYKPLRNLEISSNFYFTQSKSASGAPAYGSINTINGVLPVYTKLADDKGQALPLYHQYRQGFIEKFGDGKLMDWRYYPLNDYLHVSSQSKLQDLNAVLGINYTLVPGLNIDVKYRYEHQTVDNTILSDQQSYFTRNLINSFTQLSVNRTIYKVPKGDILDLSNSQVSAQNLRGQINYDKVLGAHNFTLIGGSEISETINQGNAYRTYGYNGDVLTSVNVDYATPYPNLITGGSSFISSASSFNKTNTRFLSFYANGAYTYLNKYTFSGSIRRDASNMFGVSINDKWKPLWSAGAIWDISKEDFYTSDLFPELKLRLTYGSQGNIDPSKVALLTLKYQGTSPFTQSPRGEISNYVNPDLKWEQVSMINAAIDFSSKNNRLSGSIEFYKKYITDLYGPSAIDVTTGLSTNTITKNIGSMSGQGLDIQLNSINTGGAIRWTSSLIFNTYTDKVTKYYSSSEFSPGQLVGNSGAIEGNPSFYLAVYKWAGLDPQTGDPRGYLNGVVSSDWDAITGNGSTANDIRYIGPRLPVIYGSLGNTLSWKGFSLAARLTYKFGYYFLRNSINYTSLVNNLQGHGDYALRWKQSGDEMRTSVPSFIYPVNNARDLFYQNSEPLVSKGDHIRLQYINLSYTLNKNQLSTLPFKSIQLYSVINNVGILWKANKFNIDPDFAGLPPSTSYSLGLKLDF